MKSENRSLLFCLTLLVGVPVLYAIGDWLGGPWLAAALPAAAAIASGVYAWRGDRPTPPPGSTPPQPMAGTT